jgi:two-component system, cell cycle sensor histidine kinase and response regulator CckA
MSDEHPNPDSPLTILLIEDNPLDAELFGEFLADSGARDFRVIHVPRLSLALERLDSEEIDIVFLDFILPDSDGLSGLAKLRRRAPKVPVIMLTGLDDEGVGLDAVAAGAQDYLVKGQIAQRRIWRILQYAILRKRIEDQSREQQVLEAHVQRAQRAESLEVLAGGIAHEFNNLLTGILGNVSMALAELPNDSPLHAMLEEIQAAAQRAGKVTAQMLAYSGRGKFAKTDLDLSRLVTDLMPLVEPAVRGRGQLVVQGSPRPLPIYGAPQELRQAIVSLITNAVESLREPDQTIRVVASAVRLTETTVFEQGSLRTQLEPGVYATVTVSDTGCGIPAQNMPRIFDPFFTTKFAGRGLGLAGVLGVVRSHGGVVKVTSEEDRGTTVQVLLPSSEVAEPPADVVAADLHSWRWDGLALVVDAEPLIVSLTRKILGRHGMEVVAAGDWRAGLEVVSAKGAALKLVMLDHDRLPPDPGAALDKLRAQAPDVPLLLWGGHLEDAAGQQLRGLPRCAFLPKPFPPMALLGKVHELLSPARPGAVAR